MGSNVIDVGDQITKLAAASTAKYLRVRSSAGTWVISGAVDRSDGVSIESQFTVGSPLAAQLIQPGHLFRFLANATIAVDDPIWGDVNGKVTNVNSVGAEFLGIAQCAAVAGGIVDVLTKVLRTVEGQSTTVTASDAIVTGLSKVLSVVANLDSAPVLTCDRATGSIGDQAGTPAAGSFLLQTWMPTSVSNPTPIAATTFSKKANWIARGY